MLCNLEALGAGVGLESFGLILVLGDGIGLTAVLTVGEGFVPVFEGGGGGAGRFFLLLAENELILLLVDNAGDGGERRVTFE